jgi:hypothetical protein
VTKGAGRFDHEKNLVSDAVKTPESIAVALLEADGVPERPKLASKKLTWIHLGNWAAMRAELHSLRTHVRPQARKNAIYRAIPHS